MKQSWWSRLIGKKAKRLKSSPQTHIDRFKQEALVVPIRDTTGNFQASETFIIDLSGRVYRVRGGSMTLTSARLEQMRKPREEINALFDERKIIDVPEVFFEVENEDAKD